MEASVQRFQEEQQRFLDLLGFDWKSIPRVQHESLSGHPLDAPASLELTLADSRRVALRDLYQYYVYAGALAGFPPLLDHFLLTAVQSAQRLFPEYGARPTVLEPLVHTAASERPGQESAYPYPLVWLPPVCTVARFESAPVGRDIAGCSTLVVVWFQDGYGLSEDERLRGQLRALDWIAHAIDIEY